ncbi:MAG: site-specific integrase [Rhodocyclaceae bacterium]|nr:site-specific integrase [Rhodocyclaceae bacterium]
MATIRKRGDYQWQAIVKRKGYPLQSKTFELRKDAEAWARMIEREMDTGAWMPRSEAESITLAEALERYAREETPRKKGAAQEMKRVRAWSRHPLARLALTRIRGVDLARYRDERRAAGVADATIRLELMLLSAIYEKARKDWGIVLANPVRTISLPSPSRRRERRLEEGEEARLLDALEDAMPRTPARALAVVAIETGMRQGELLGLEWSDIDLRRRIAHLDDTKSGDPRDVPLSGRAIEALQSIPRRIDGKVFGISQDRVMRGFKSACKRAGIEDLKFHDLRHEAASRLATKLSAHELCKMLGWKTMQMALRYYHPRAEDLARKLG